MPDISNVHAPRPDCMYAIYPRSNKNPDIKYIHQHYTLQLEHLIQNDAPQHLVPGLLGIIGQKSQSFC